VLVVRMIVDVHTHLPRNRQPAKSEKPKYYTARPGHPIDMDALCWDDHYKAMRNVDRAIVFGLSFGRDKHENDNVAEYVRMYGGKFIGFLTVDPNGEDALEEVERCVNELKLKGIKLGPAYQNFHPYSERACAIYSKAVDLGLPIIFHMGATPGKYDPMEYSYPLILEKVAIAFPDLKMVVAHMGHPWIPDTIILIRKHPNVYADISALFYRPWQFYNALVLANEYDQMHKLLLGSDWPVTTPEETINNLRRINLIVEGTNLPRIPERKIEEIINRDALEILGISP